MVRYSRIQICFFENIKICDSDFLDQRVTMQSHTWSVDRSYTAEQLKLHFLSEQAGSGGNAERYDLVMELKFE